MMKYLIAIFIFSSLLTAQEPVSSSPKLKRSLLPEGDAFSDREARRLARPLFEEDSLFSEMDDEDGVSHHRFYFSAGLNPFPTVYIGYRGFYHGYGSDLSIFGSAVPLFGDGPLGTGDFWLPIPGLEYKHLFFTENSWQKFRAGKAAFYVGIGAAILPVGLNPEGVIGWQFNHLGKLDFFEIGTHALYITISDRRVKVDTMPFSLVSLKYGVMF